MRLLLPNLRPISSGLQTQFKFQSKPISNHSPTAIKSLARMSTSAGIPSAIDLGIENTDIETAPGVELSSEQKVIVGSVLDLFAGKPSLKKLSLWTDDASFQDNITLSQGRKQYSAQWYGLPAVFSSITRLNYSVTSGNNPITMNLKTNYKLKGVGKETIIESLVEIWTVQEGPEKGKIEKVADKWNGELPEGVFAKAFRNLNAVTVPMLVSVPKSEEEDVKRGL